MKQKGSPIPFANKLYFFEKERINKIKCTFLQFASLHLSFSSGYPSMSVSFPHRYPLPAQPIPHWQDKWNNSEKSDSKSVQLLYINNCALARRLFIRMHEWCETLPDKWLIHLFLQNTGHWHHRGWSGCCCSWPPACSLSPDLLWNQIYSCRSDRSPVQEWAGLGISLFRSKGHRNKTICCCM